MNHSEIISSFQELIDEYPMVKISCNLQYLTKKYDDCTIWTFRDSLMDCILAKRPIGSCYKVNFTKIQMRDKEMIEKIQEIIKFCMVRVGSKLVHKINIYSTNPDGVDGFYIFTEMKPLNVINTNRINES